MDIKKTRYLNARHLVKQAGSVTAFADKIDRSQSQVSQFAGENPIKGIGHNMARLIEDTFSKPNGWLDRPHEDISTSRETVVADKVAKAYLDSSAEMRQAIQRMLGILEDSDK